jgi:hypothetical protein
MILSQKSFGRSIVNNLKDKDMLDRTGPNQNRFDQMNPSERKHSRHYGENYPRPGYYSIGLYRIEIFALRGQIASEPPAKKTAPAEKAPTMNVELDWRAAQKAAEEADRAQALQKLKDEQSGKIPVRTHRLETRAGLITDGQFRL